MQKTLTGMRWESAFAYYLLIRKKEHLIKWMQKNLAGTGSHTKGVVFTADDCPGEEGRCQGRLQAGWTGAGGDGARGGGSSPVDQPTEGPEIIQGCGRRAVAAGCGTGM